MTTLEEFGIDATRMSGDALLARFDARIKTILADVQRSPVWAAVMSNDEPLDVVIDVLREIYLEIVMYQPDAIEGAIAAIAQFPRTMPVIWFEEMLHHQVEEFDHGEMALRDYIALGGDEQEARARRQSPSAFAVAAMWHNIVHDRDPFLYLGAVYLFEGLTPIITGQVKDHLNNRIGSFQGLEFIGHHATADLEHTRQIQQLIREIVAHYPDNVESLIYGFEYFAHVYPLPVWTAALQRARRRPTIARLAAE